MNDRERFRGQADSQTSERQRRRKRLAWWRCRGKKVLPFYHWHQACVVKMNEGNSRGSHVAKRRQEQHRRELQVANRNKLIIGDRIHGMTQRAEPVKLLQDDDWVKRQKRGSSILTTKSGRWGVDGNSSASSVRGEDDNKDSHNTRTTSSSTMRSVNRSMGNCRSYSPPRSREHRHQFFGSTFQEDGKSGMLYDGATLDDSPATFVNYDTISSVRQRFKRGGTRWWKILYEPKFAPSLRPATLEFSGSLSRSSKRTIHQPLWKLERMGNVHMHHFTQALSSDDRFYPK